MNDQSVLGMRLIPSVEAELLSSGWSYLFAGLVSFTFRSYVSTSLQSRAQGRVQFTQWVPAGQLSESPRSRVGSQRAGLHPEQKDYDWVHGPDLQGGLLCVDTWERK